LLAKSAGQGFNVDAEEADRLSLSLDVIDAVVSDPALAGWDGFGVVVQAYGPRCGAVIDWLYDLAGRNDRRLMVRLVKGAYWDAEIKRAQVLGLAGFPVFTAKSATDISYAANARKLLGMTDRLYPQFATHNAQTVETVLRMAETSATPTEAFEFQRLHGMGEVLHRLVMAEHGTRCRIYAPVGAHKDLLAYLVRRLLENGANSSFVNQIVDADVPPEIVAADPFDIPRIDAPIETGPNLFQPGRSNSKGWDVTHRPTLAGINAARDRHRGTEWEARPLLASAWQQSAEHTARGVRNPANPGETVGSVIDATPRDAAAALEAARPWTVPVGDRADVLRQAAAVY
jgi:RHH-type proline utilization regulon transcriptional repressor/proline dehydrogenase/delta 1-pyrroline-5-carboxylate dehydrogenase